MKPNKFVKKHGYKVVKSIINTHKNYTHVIAEVEYKKHAPHFADSLKDAVKIEDLKILVESHELVALIGGDLEGAKKVYEFTKDSVNIALHDRIVPVSLLKQAIADVESCK